jgi:hypothetical protein
MTWSVDARIPVLVLPDDAALPAALAAGKPAAVLSVEAPPPGPFPALTFATDQAPHPAACDCCQGRSPAADALDRLFQARVRGQCAWFDRVLVLPEHGAAAAIRDALRQDVMAAARFRLA